MSVVVLCVAALLPPACGVPPSVGVSSIHSFTGGADGGEPAAALALGADGYFYGTTYSGGTNGGWGTVFRVSGSGAFTSLHSFSAGGGGGNPYAALVEGEGGSFYGTTSEGGGSDSGTVFILSADLSEAVLCPSIGANGGAQPGAWLTAGGDGSLYCTTVEETNSLGSVCRINTNGTLTLLHAFTGGEDGGFPDGPVAFGVDGGLYGAAQFRGTHNAGSLFKINSAGLFTNLHSFTGTNDGAYPKAALTQCNDGNFYGATAGGGTNGGSGTLFKISGAGALTSLYSFTGTNDGGGVNGGLVQGSDGYIYGTTSFGGASNQGTVFRISTNGAFSSLYSFSGGKDGAEPRAGLVQGSDRSFYGTTALGGLDNAGTVFRVTVLPEIQPGSFTNGAFNLTWNAEAGATYQAQFNGDLDSHTWTNLGGPLLATGATLGVTDTNGSGGQRFYRVLVLP